MPLRWNDAYKIGHAEIDAQHQELFKLVHVFLNASDKGSLTKCAMALFKYTRVHFEHEEALMKELNYPRLKAHHAQHAELLSLLGELAKKIADESLDMVELEAFLSSWLLEHIGTSDARLAAYVKLAS